MNRCKIISLVLAFAVALPATGYAAKQYGPGVTDDQIMIGETAPLSGPVSGYGVVAKAGLAYFAMINARGGVNGRKIKLILADDGYNPAKTVEQVRRLVEEDHVLLLYAPVGTATNLAVRKYLNARKIPQILLASGVPAWNDPSRYPWSMAGLPSYVTEAQEYARYILAHRPNGRLAVLYQDDDFGRAYLKGLREGLGDKAKNIVVATQSFEVTDPTVDSQIISLADSKADMFLYAGTSKQAVQALKEAAKLGWHPLKFVSSIASSIERTYVPAGNAASQGTISSTVFLDPKNPAFHDNKGLRDYLHWVTQYDPQGDPYETLNVAAYVEGELFVHILRNCGDDLTRKNVMWQAAHLNDVAVPMLWPGVTVSSSPTNYNLFKHLQLIQFDGKQMRPISTSGNG
jgi:branched-chain amino acid transport system substrate-binding protein